MDLKGDSFETIYRGFEAGRKISNFTPKSYENITLTFAAPEKSPGRNWVLLLIKLLK